MLFSEILDTSQVPQFKDICIIFHFHESSPSVQTPDIMSKGDFYSTIGCVANSIFIPCFTYGND